MTKFRATGCRGSARTRASKRGTCPLKRRHFAVIGSNNVKTVADRYIHAAYRNKLFIGVNVYDLVTKKSKKNFLVNRL